MFTCKNEAEIEKIKILAQEKTTEYLNSIDSLKDIPNALKSHTIDSSDYILCPFCEQQHESEPSDYDDETDEILECAQCGGEFKLDVQIVKNIESVGYKLPTKESK